MAIEIAQVREVHLRRAFTGSALVGATELQRPGLEGIHVLAAIESECRHAAVVDGGRFSVLRPKRAEEKRSLFAVDPATGRVFEHRTIPTEPNGAS
jgi:hypothetical protein